MCFKNISGIYWTNLELKGLLEDEDSFVYFEKVKKHLALHPFHTTNLQVALCEILDTCVNSYDSELSGVILSYKNPKLLSPLGYILYDTCFVHVDVEADFYIFRPEIGKSLKGFVNKKSINHIGILVHKTFNISILKSEDDEEWPGDKVSPGQEVRFTLTEVNYNSKIPFFRGVLKKEDYLDGCQLFNEEIAETCDNEFVDSKNYNHNKILNVKRENKHFLFNSDSEEDVKSENEITQKKKKKKSKKKQDSDEENDVKRNHEYLEDDKNLLNGENTIINNVSMEETNEENLKKKKKKRKHLDSEPENEKEYKVKVKDFSELVEKNIKNSESSPKKKKSKKNKQVSESEDEKPKIKEKISKHNLNLVNYDSVNTDDEKKIKNKIKKVTAENNLDHVNSCELQETIQNKKRKRAELTSSSDDEKLTKKAIQKVSVTETSSNKKKNKVVDNYPSDTEDEKCQKSKLKKELAAKEIEGSPKKKKQKLSQDNESENEKSVKKLIKKIKNCDEIEPKSDKNVINKKEKKYEENVCSADNEESNESNDNNSSVDYKFSVPKSKVKKKKNNIDDVALVDTEDELNHKLKVKEYMQDFEMQTEEKTKSKKKKKKHRESLDKTTLIDTDDEKKYKSEIQEYVKESKKKKKHLNATSESADDAEFGLLDKIKSEPESDIDGNIVKKKSKKKKKDFN